MIGNIPLDGQIMGDLIFIIADRNDLPFHHKFRANPALVNGLAMKQSAGSDVVIQLFDDLFIRFCLCKVIIDCKTSRKKAALAGKDHIKDHIEDKIELIVNPEQTDSGEA